MMVTTGKERSPAIRFTAQERRDAIIDAAMHEFAPGGFYDTAAAVIALRADVSQLDLFALSGTKRNQFIAAVKRGFERRRSLSLRAAGEGGAAGDALNGVRTALLSLPRDRTLLPLQLHTFAACEDLDVRALRRAESEKTSRTMASASGAPDRLLRCVPAEQAKPSVAAAMDLPEAVS
jgi:AcrR family transcriptional regulator